MNKIFSLNSIPVQPDMAAKLGTEMNGSEVGLIHQLQLTPNEQGKRVDNFMRCVLLHDWLNHYFA